jgi:serine/threonine protein kinase
MDAVPPSPSSPPSRSGTGRRGATTRILAGIAEPAGVPPNSPTFFGHYVIQHVLAEGGLGAVLKAVHIPTNRTVALKVPNPRTLQSQEAGQSVMSTFAGEIAAMVACEGPGVIPLYDAGVVGAVPYIAMRFIEGGGCDRFVDGQELPRAPRVAMIVQQAIEGLATIHDAGWIHRDVKLGNLLVAQAEQGAWQVAWGDLGNAIPAQDGRTCTTQGIAGTVAYVPPELLNGYPWTTACDVYALGLTVASLVSRQPLYPGMTNDEVLQAKRDQHPPLRMDVIPEAWQPLVQATLAPCEERPRIEALRALVPGRAPAVRPSVMARLTRALVRKSDPTMA